MSDKLEGTIIRSPRDSDRPYFIMRRDTAQDIDLSYEALGMLTYILSKPDDWKVVIKDLHSRDGIGRDKAYRVLNELLATRYIIHEGQSKNAAGVFGKSIYRVYDFPQSEVPCTENPYTENQDAYIKENTETTSKDSKLSLCTAQVEPQKETPKEQPASTPVQEQEETPPKSKKWSIKDHVEQVWGEKNAGMAGQLTAQMLGIVKQEGKRKIYNFKQPVNAIEVWGFRYWWKANFPGLVLPATAETLSERFDAFRGAPDYIEHMSSAQNVVTNQLYLPVEERTAQADEPKPDEPTATDEPTKDYSAEIEKAINDLVEKFST